MSEALARLRKPFAAQPLGMDGLMPDAMKHDG